MAEEKETRNTSHIEIENQSETLRIDFEKKKVTIQLRYEWLHIINDFLLALWFLVGSFFFFHKDLMNVGTSLFILGSAQMMLGPIIQMVHKVHLKSINSNSRS